MTLNYIGEDQVITNLPSDIEFELEIEDIDYYAGIICNSQEGINEGDKPQWNIGRALDELASDIENLYHAYKESGDERLRQKLICYYYLYKGASLNFYNTDRWI